MEIREIIRQYSNTGIYTTGIGKIKGLKKKISVRLINKKCVKERYVWEYSSVVVLVKKNCMTLARGVMVHELSFSTSHNLGCSGGTT